MKKDIKYIIKRVVIGVLIAIIFASINKCNAYAQTINVKLQQFNPVMSFPQSTSGLYSLFELDSPYSSNKYNYYSLFNVSESNKFYAIFKDNTNNTYLYLIFNNFGNTANLDMSKVNLLQYTDLGNTSYVFQFYNTSTNQFQTSGGYTYGFILSDNEISDFTDIFTITNPTKYNSPITGEYFYTNGSQPQLSENIFNNFTLYDTNLSELYIDNQSVEILPNDYYELDLTGYQGVLLVPKNYPYLASEFGFTGTDNKEYIHYTYGYKNCIKSVLIDLTTLKDWSSYSPWLDNSTDIVCNQDFSLDTLDYEIQTNNKYNYMGILIYNNSTLYDTNTNDWVNNQSNPYGTSYVYVNTEYYDYYLISNYATFNQSISFDDFEGMTTTVFISTLPTFSDLVSEIFPQDTLNDTTTTKQKIDKLFGIVKLPFEFLKNITTGTCEPLSARFPHSNFDIELPCLSSSFESFMGSALYNMLRLVINGLLVYRISMSLMVFTAKRIDPKDMRLDVVQL